METVEKVTVKDLKKKIIDMIILSVAVATVLFAMIGMPLISFFTPNDSTKDAETAEMSYEIPVYISQNSTEKTVSVMSGVYFEYESDRDYARLWFRKPLLIDKSTKFDFYGKNVSPKISLLMRDVLSIEGVTDVTVRAYCMDIEKSDNFDWGEISVALSAVIRDRHPDMCVSGGNIR